MHCAQESTNWLVGHCRAILRAALPTSKCDLLYGAIQVPTWVSITELFALWTIPNELDLARGVGFSNVTTAVAAPVFGTCLPVHVPTGTQVRNRNLIVNFQMQSRAQLEVAIRLTQPTKIEVVPISW